MKFRNHRYPARYPVALICQGVQQSATVYSISSGGAAVVLQKGVPAVSTGSDIVLRHSGGQMSGKVCWQHGEKAGVRFAQVLSSREVDRIRQGVGVGMMRHSHASSLTELR